MEAQCFEREADDGVHGLLRDSLALTGRIDRISEMTGLE
jgi:hypothetical protein